MYLFQHVTIYSCLIVFFIYIPLCIYFNLGWFTLCILIASFTFHYVSISTHIGNTSVIRSDQIYIPLCIYFNDIGPDESMCPECYLHSTMYLFQRGLTDYPKDGGHSFTFHYVSISTKSELAKKANNYLFTFHYVSISTRSRHPAARRQSNIYIPLCIYFNQIADIVCNRFSVIYIPLCIYFNRA